MQTSRRAGILLHPSSLPGSGGIGTLGAEAIQLIDFLHQTGFTLWQILPLTPPAAGNSPYSAFSVFACNHLLIDLQQLVDEGDLPQRAIKNKLPTDRVDFENLIPWKEKLLQQAATSFFNQQDTERLHQFWQFCDSNYWLHDYALFSALRKHYRNRPWHRWPKGLARRESAALEKASMRFGQEIGIQKYQQWQFFRQWQKLKEYASKKNIGIIGDLPIFVSHDSADVWCNQNLFLLNGNSKPKVVAGVPPDYFSTTGQLWGNPLYNWQTMQQDGYAWWIARIKLMLQQFDLIRIDHFRGFEAAWHVSAKARTAIKGNWEPGPGYDFFNTLQNTFGKLPFIAEDLGIITKEVEDLRDYYSLPGMKILQFAFDSDAANPYLPHNHLPNSVVYTGTHDNDTTLGWFKSLPPKTVHRMYEYLDLPGLNPVRDIIRTALASVASTTIIPLQDLLELPTEARMNTPGVALGNWDWRYSSEQLTKELSEDYAVQLKRYGR